MSSSVEQILDQFHIVCRQRDSLSKQLSQTKDMVKLLEAEIAALKYHADLALAKAADEQGLSKGQIERTSGVKFIGPAAWIHDIWFCNPKNADLLGLAEKAWQENMQNPQSAILLITEALKTKLIKKDRVLCKLFLVAIQLFAASLEPAYALANECIEECRSDPRFTDLVGVACYLRGRIFLAMKIYPEAHWDFSMAVLTPGYHEQAKRWQGHCQSLLLEVEDGSQRR